MGRKVPWKTYDRSKPGTEKDPEAIMIRMIEDRALSLWMDTGTYSHEKFGLILEFSEDKKHGDKSVENFMEEKWPDLDPDERQNVEASFKELDSQVLTPFCEWLETIREKMGIKPPRKMRPYGRKKEGVEIFLRRLSRDLRK